MVQSNHWKFSDPFSYQRTIRAADVQIVLKAKGEFRAELTRVDFSQLWMLRSHESLPRISHAANEEMWLQSGEPPLWGYEPAGPSDSGSHQ